MNRIAPASADEFLGGLRNQRVLVTAGGSGIGFAIAATLSKLGARVVICDVSQTALDEARTAITPIHAMLADVSREDDVERMFAEVTSTLGGLDALINNAGIAGPTGSVDEITTDDWRRCIDICLTGQFLCTRLAVPLLKASGGGSIVNMSSAAGRHGYAYRTPYSAAKFGVIGFTQSLAKELGPHSIRVNAILPGIVEGPRIENVISNRAKQLGLSHEAMTERYLENVSLRRMVSPYDVASMVAFLLSNAGVNISGQSLGVDGNVETL
ncbi:SDR family oxidoreductase [Phyllobacterium myrsinacearum]|uniref:NAD(P)-dependent dehydrogenase (Short-subunit alcohol dehydrogenase family) n=1 Tax=Phyllobacterium myrsinacearum TaxID=28101 RepID=A0A839EWR4_9HYPH|nr:SDR family oxidoreductase [Phyllobacterium myrsinacearum]MBA8880950.1 NAD(P)-dependent dehydrogenase (short-subunit alcohol dehydrogenase family) [Phyllobacterium myrsinacearum]